MNKSKKELLEQKLEEFGFDEQSQFYRYTSKKYLIEENNALFIKAKDECADMIIDHYDDQGHFFVSKEMGMGLSFLKNPENEYEQSDRVRISVKLKDVLNQGGLIYEITSLPAYLKGYFVSLPEGRVKVSTL
jgi:hypothetical protein